ncbi:MAG: hypothetical protein ACOX3T_08495 [Bdellovibrionota bacterium]
MSKDSNMQKKLTDSHIKQINLLKAMSKDVVESGKESRKYEIEEINAICGLNDERETQRYLFILEGQKLVSPSPEGDFTSTTWYVTKRGLDAVKLVSNM